MSPEYWDQPEVFNPKQLDLPNQKLLAINDSSCCTGLVQKARRVGTLRLTFLLVQDQGVVLE